MKRKVYCYQTISDLKSNKYYEYLSAFPQLTSTVHMKKAMSEAYPEIIAYDIYSVIRRIFRIWYSIDTSASQYVNLGYIIRDRISSASANHNLLRAFYKNRKDVLNAIRLMEETGVETPIDSGMGEETEFFAIWKECLQRDKSFLNFRELFDNFKRDSHFFLKTIEVSFPGLLSSTIVVHGFYYISPIQERFFELLENCGIKLIFLCNCSSKPVNVNEIWRKTFCDTDKYEWVVDDASPCKLTSTQYKFGKVLDGEKVVKSAAYNISIIKFDSERTFMENIPQIINRGYRIYAPNSSYIEKLLIEKYPESSKTSLFAYPICNFYYVILLSWNKLHQQVEITVSDFQKCLFSNTPYLHSSSSERYPEFFEQLAPYFQDCKTDTEWKKRFNILRDFKQNIYNRFDDNVPDDRWSKTMGNPFQNFSCFSVDIDTVNQIEQLVQRVFDLSKAVFNSDSVALASKILIDNATRCMSTASTINVHPLEQLISILSSVSINDTKCCPDDISDILLMILSGQVPGVENEDEDENIRKYNLALSSLNAIETAPLLTEKVHICNCDENNMPGSCSPLPWPLSYDLLERLYNQSVPLKKVYLFNLINRGKNISLINRYLFYCALQNKNIEISWVAQENEKRINPSPYVSLLMDLVKKGATLIKDDISLEKLEQTIDSCTYASGANIIKKAQFPNYTIPEEEKDKEFCIWRYLYGYELGKYPTYQTNFHYNFLLSSITAVINTLESPGRYVRNAHQIADNIIGKYFPYFSEIEKNKMADNAPIKKMFESEHLRGSQQFNGMQYSNLRLIPHYLTHPVYLSVYSPKNKTDNNTEDLFFKYCVYCPHNGKCTKQVKDGSSFQ